MCFCFSWGHVINNSVITWWTREQNILENKNFTIRFCWKRNWKIPFRTSNVEVIGKSRKDEYMLSLFCFINVSSRSMLLNRINNFKPLSYFWLVKNFANKKYAFRARNPAVSNDVQVWKRAIWVYFIKRSFMFESSNIRTWWRQWSEINSISSSKICNGFGCSFFFFCDSFDHFKFDLKNFINHDLF